MAAAEDATAEERFLGVDFALLALDALRACAGGEEKGSESVEVVEVARVLRAVEADGRGALKGLGLVRSGGMVANREFGLFVCSASRSVNLSTKDFLPNEIV